MALKYGLIKFQPYIEGERIIAVTDHATLIWSKTFQNVNRRLLTWGTVFAAYPELQIVHRAGRVHSNVDPISRLRRRTPYYESLLPPNHESAKLSSEHETLSDFYSKMAPDFEERLLHLTKGEAEAREDREEDQQRQKQLVTTSVPMETSDGVELIPYTTSRHFSVIVHMEEAESTKIAQSYSGDNHFGKVLARLEEESQNEVPRERSQYPQYVLDKGLIYFSNWDSNYRVCIGKALQQEIIAQVHDILTEGAHAGYVEYQGVMGSAGSAGAVRT